MDNTTILATLIQLGAVDRNAEVGVYTESMSTARRLIALNADNNGFPPDSRRPEPDQHQVTQEEIETLVNTLAYEQQAQLNLLEALSATKDAKTSALFLEQALAFDKRHTLIHALNLLKFRGFSSNSASKLYFLDWQIMMALKKGRLHERSLTEALRQIDYHHPNQLRCFKGLKQEEGSPIFQVCFRSPVYYRLRQTSVPQAVTDAAGLRRVQITHHVDIFDFSSIIHTLVSNLSKAGLATMCQNN